MTNYPNTPRKMTPKENLNDLATRATAKLQSTPLRDQNQHRVVRLDFVARAFEATCANGALGVAWRLEDVTAFVGADKPPHFTRRYSV